MSQTALEVTSLLSDLEGASWLKSKSRAAWKKHQFFQILVWVVSEKHIFFDFFFTLILEDLFFPCILGFFRLTYVSIRGCDLKNNQSFKGLHQDAKALALQLELLSVPRGNAAESKRFGGRKKQRSQATWWMPVPASPWKFRYFLCVLNPFLMGFCLKNDNFPSRACQNDTICLALCAR